MMKRHLFVSAVLAAVPLGAGAAQAHVMIAPTTAPAGTAQTLTVVVGHGCDGQPTTALRVEFPPGVTRAEAEPKPGWTVGLERLAGGGWAVAWRGGEAAGHQMETFPVNVRLAATPGALPLKVVQTCGATAVRWDEAPGPDGAKPKHPAPVLTLTDGR